MEFSLYNQCSLGSFAGVCRALADVYYAAVRAFGGNDATKRDLSDELVHEYEAKLAIYKQLVKEAQDAGLLAVCETRNGIFFDEKRKVMKTRIERDEGLKSTALKNLGFRQG